MTPFEIQNLHDLSNYLRCRESLITSILDSDFHIIDNLQNELNSRNWYHDYFSGKYKGKIIIQKMYIPKKKKTNSYRVVYSIKTDAYSNILKTLNSHLSTLYLPYDNVHGFIQYRGIKTNATQHLGKKLLLTVDIYEFFETVDINLIVNAFVKLGFNENISEILSRIVTLYQTLVKGYNTSPIIANMVCEEMDKELNKIAVNDIIYTRYADDLYFSSDHELPKLELIEQIINKNGFALNHAKTKLMRRGEKQYVTGLTIFDKNNPRISKKIKRNLRLEIYHIKKWGMLHHTLNQLGHSYEQYENLIKVQYEVESKIEENYNRINGWIQFIRSIELRCGNKLFNDLNNTAFS